jgi:thiazole synthase
MTIVQTEPATDSALILGGRSFRSRLMVGTGKYRNNDDMVRAIEASGAEIVTAGWTSTEAATRAFSIT